MNSRYTTTAILLHWLMAIGLIGNFALGAVMHELDFSPAKLQLYAWHKWAGVTLFALLLARLAWRIGNPPPPLPGTLSALARQAAGLAHAMLYVLMLAIPLSGWLMSSAKGVPTVWFGVLPLPDLVGKSAGLGHFLEEVHERLNFALLVLVGIHVAAALKHRLIDRDDILARMWPWHGRH